MNKFWSCLLVLIWAGLLIPFQSSGQDTVIVKTGKIERNFGKKIMLLKDPGHRIDMKAALTNKDYLKVNTPVPNLGVSNATYWLKFLIRNESNSQDLMLRLALPTIDYLDFFVIDSSQKVVRHEMTGDRLRYGSRRYDNPIPTLRFNLPAHQTYTVLLKIHGGEQLQVPLTAGNSNSLMGEIQTASIIFGLYIGIISVMFIYNLFLFLSTKDKSYLYYIIYILIIGLTQANFQGYAFKYLWPDNTWLSTHAVYILSSLAALSAIEFMKQFLHTRDFLPVLHKTLNFFYIPYLFALISTFFGNLNLGYQVIQVTAVAAAMYMLVIAFMVYLKGFRPAKFFLLAWSVFLLGVCSFVLKDYNILEYNTLTYNMMPFGSALEVVLLSFALADKINTFKKEKEESQAQALKISLENELLIKQQNVELEKKVYERTLELQDSNKTLEITLKDLKEAQSQLVDSEKMAGLGQLTAGIAHEINNPINFVTSNIKPLELDIEELNEVIHMYENLNLNEDLSTQLNAIESFKKRIDLNFVRDEIKSLLSGIGEGAKRTAEIIRSLKNFSRLDENDCKYVDLNEGLDSTLVLVRNTFPSNLKIVKNYGNLPKVECMPGKVNQVFMNLISNAIQAIKGKAEHVEEEKLTISTWHEGEQVKIGIKDTGPGMTEEVKQKIFEPFFTTKDVGEGTGLGLSIVFRIIENHHGQIDVITKVNHGTEFIITLPVTSR
ncbi:7TM diverse intracellular signaling domain-containing protein [Pedobacter steynii]|uniref:histidine kinase n=1 Tax=Pedobacter steynii TaxID=430522 RepID=A0A1D7QB50_9SPHI|nr:7TM diverse intracellular signaling domain-containing protein [Pedobacter steynii]AOM75891.1 hypothetical protein BFS30_01110 [Pedobacter steynii]